MVERKSYLLLFFLEDNFIFLRFIGDKIEELLYPFQDETPKFVTSVCFSADEEVITGDSRGSITVWRRDKEDAFRVDALASEPMAFTHKVTTLSPMSANIYRRLHFSMGRGVAL